MYIQDIHLKGFMRHQDSKVDLPQTGLVVVEGTNGSGKSSFIEAVAWSLYGKTLRGAPPHQDGRECYVRVNTSTLDVVKTRSERGKNTITFCEKGGQSTKWENATKAKAALASLITPYQVWRRTAAFSSSDASHFTNASDGDRKRLLEDLLGLDKFDEALASCRAHSKELSNEETSLSMRVVRLQERVAAATNRLDDYQQSADTLSDGDVDAINKKIEALNNARLMYEADIFDSKKEIQIWHKNIADLRAQANVNKSKLSRLSASHCPSCNQQIPEALKESLEAEVVKSSKAVSSALSEFAQTEQDIENVMLEANESIRSINDSVQSNKLVIKEILLRKTIGDKIAAVEDDLHRFQSELSSLQEKLSKCRKELATVKVCETVLGLKGVRAHIIAQSLAGIQGVANSWLERIAGEGLRLELSPYTEKSSGGISDAISINIIGAGGGHGYKAASGGERRRIDVALLFALLEVAEAASGHRNGTLFFDEVFDALDKGGVEAVVESLHEIAKHRAVVVITHSADLSSKLRAVLRLNVIDGNVRHSYEQ